LASIDGAAGLIEEKMLEIACERGDILRGLGGGMGEIGVRSTEGVGEVDEKIVQIASDDVEKRPFFRNTSRHNFPLLIELRTKSTKN